MKINKNLRPEEVFTPSQPANYTFIERASVNKRLDRALRTPGKQLIIYGHSGAGKTTLLANKFKSQKIKSITTRCVTGMNLGDIVRDAFSQLEVFYVSTTDSTTGGKVGGGLSASYFGMKAQISAEAKEDEKVTLKRATELPISPQTLAKFIGESGNLWVIEDYHKIKGDDKILMAQIMKVFMDSSVDYPNLKIIAIGAVNSAREVVQYDPEMKNRISEVEVPLMDKEHLRDILLVGQELLNIKIPEGVIKKIVTYSSGLPAVTHQLGLLLCEVNNIERRHSSNLAKSINSASFEEAIEEYLAENSDTLKSIFESATRVIHKRKVENPTEILRAVLNSKMEDVSLHQIKKNLQLVHKGYNGNNLKKYVDELTTSERSEILRYNKDSGTYYFSNPFIKAYSQCSLRSKHPSEFLTPSSLLKDLRAILKEELEIARKAFIEDNNNYIDVN